MNPYVGIINHQHSNRKTKRKSVKKGKVKMARRSSKAHMAYVRSFRKNAKRRKAAPARRRRKSYKRNPYPMAGLVVNPRRKHSRKRRSVSAVHRRRRSHSYSRNPKIFGISLPPMEKVLFAGIGFVAPPMVEGLVAGFIPASIQSSTIGKYAVRIGVVAAIGYAIGRFLGREKGNMALIGGGIYIATTAAMEFVPSIFGAHVPTIPQVQTSALSGYVPARGQLRSYVPANQRINNSLGMPSAAFDNNESSGAFGGTAARFNRF